MTEYLSEFVQESKGYITDLNNALLELERNPEDGEAMDEVFRTAHTLKGNAGAMGLDGASDLAHALEDLLDAIRAGSLEVSPELMDDVFDGVDLLEEMVDDVERAGEIQTDPSERIDALRSWIEETTGLVKPTDDQIETTLRGLDRTARRQHQVYHVRLSIAEDSGGVVLDALRDAFDLLTTDPDESAIRAGDHDGSIDVAFGSAVDEAAIAAALDPVDAVQEAIITEVDDRTVEAAVEATEPAGGSAAGEATDVDPDDLSVDQLLDQFTEYDDLDEAVERVDDIEGLDMDDLGEAGSFDDVVEEPVDTATETAGQTGDGTEAEPTEEAEPTAEAEPTEETEPAADEEVEDPMAEFEELQDEYDQVGLDQMESELEGVTFGEYDEEDEVGFDELLGDEVEAEGEAEAEPATEPAEAKAEAEATTGVPAPEESTIGTAIEEAAAPTDPAQEVFHVRLGIVPAEEVNNGQLVVEALRDAFDLLGTRPPEDEISLGEYDEYVDALFGAEVSVPEIESALDPVEEVDDVVITTVTDRVTFPEPTPDAEAAPSAEGDLDPEVIEAEGEIQDARTEFQQMQQAFDQVGLDEIESELEGVSFGEYDEQEEVGFDELLEEDVAEPAAGEAGASAEPTAETPTGPTVEAPADDVIDSALEAAGRPEDPDNDVFHVRLGIVPSGDVNNGQLVVEALHDAFEVLGTQPIEDAIDRGEYDDHVDAVFASHVGRGEIESALDPVDEVSDAAITEVTSRIEVPEPAESVDEPATTDAGTGADADADAEAAAGGDDEVEDPMAEFEQLQDEYDRVGLDQMESELEGVSFGEYDEEDEVGFDELLEDVPVAESDVEAEPADVDAEAEPADVDAEAEPAGADAEAGTTGASADAGAEADAGAGDFGEAEAGTGDFGEADAGTGDFGEAEAGTGDFGEADAGAGDFGEAEAGTGDFGEPEVGGDDFGEVETGADDFGEVETGADDFGEVETGADDFGDVETVDDDLTEEDVEVGEITVEDDSIDADFGVDVEADPEEELVEAEGPSLADTGTEAEESFGEVDVGEADDFGEVDVGETDDFGDVAEPEPAEDLPEEAQASVETIKGIGSGYADRLAEADVETVGDLVTADPQRLSAETDISDSRLAEWVDRAPVSPAALSEAEAEPEAEADAEPEPEPEPATEQEVEEIQSIRVDVNRVDELLNLVEGLVTTRARLRRAVQEGADEETLLDEIDELDVISDEMQDHVVDMRLVPVRTITQRLPRVVRDIARDQGKRVRFEVEGEDVEVDRSILNRISDPLIHLIRNAVDHGIEPPEEREIAGKDEEGQVTLSVRRERDDAVIEVRDDGRGLDPDALREKAVEEGVMAEEAAEALDDEDTYELIFESGFSTTEEVTDVSGRGVGMDIVSNTVEELDGTVEIDSEPGEGTTIRLTLPVSVAISEVVFLQSGDEEYGVPIKVVDEIGGMAATERLGAENGTEMVRTADGKRRELIELHDALNVPNPAVTNGGGMVVTIEDDVREAAIHCDRVRGQQEVVVKPFDGMLADIPGLSGAAVLGEGEVVNILDVDSL